MTHRWSATKEGIWFWGRKECVSKEYILRRWYFNWYLKGVQIYKEKGWMCEGLRYIFNNWMAGAKASYLSGWECIAWTRAQKKNREAETQRTMGGWGGVWQDEAELGMRIYWGSFLNFIFVTRLYFKKYKKSIILWQFEKLTVVEIKRNR